MLSAVLLLDKTLLKRETNGLKRKQKAQKVEKNIFFVRIEWLSKIFHDVLCSSPQPMLDATTFLIMLQSMLFQNPDRFQAVKIFVFTVYSRSAPNLCPPGDNLAGSVLLAT